MERSFVRAGVRTVALLLMTSVVLTITSVAESNVSLVRKLDTLYVLPTQVESVAWKSPTQALTQDVDESAVFQTFTRSNSAYLGHDAPVQNDPVIPTVPVETSSSTETGAPSGSALPEDPQVPQEVSQPSSDASAQEETLMMPEPDAAETTGPAESSIDSPLEVLSKSFFRFTDIADILLPFAQESVETPLIDVPEAQSMPDVTSESMVPAEEQGIDAVETSGLSPTESIAEPLLDMTEAREMAAPQNETSLISPEASMMDAVETSASSEVEVITETIETNIPATVPSIIFNDFTLPPLNPGQLVRNVQLRMSLGGLVVVPEGQPLPSIEVEYTFGDDWTSAGAILLDGEVSNALNEGYFLFAMPRIMHVNELDSFAVRVSYAGNEEFIDNVYLDSVWLQLDTETFNKEVLKERLLPQELKHLALPAMYEFLSTDLDFTRYELPSFSLKYESQRNPAITFIRNLFGRNLASIQEVSLRHISGELKAIKPDVNVTGDGLISIQLTPEDIEGLQPGTYSVEIAVDEGGKVFRDSFEFQWGLIAVNPDQTEYLVGATTTIMIGAVSESGNTICNADLHLYIIDPLGYVTESPIVPSGACNGNNLTDVPDYSATVVASVPGTYEMYIERLGSNGEVLAHTQDTFRVVPAQSFRLTREGPTRINPKYAYPMTFTLTSQEGFTGELIERVPADFTVSGTDAAVAQVGDMQELRFSIALSAGETATYSYDFDAPDISPFLYALGPAELIDEKQIVVIREDISNDPRAFLNESILAQNGDAPDSGAENVPPARVEPERVPTQGGEVAQPEQPAETSQPQAALDVLPEADSASLAEDEPVASPSPDNAQDVNVTTSGPVPAAVQTDTATSTPPPAVEKNSFAEHRKWQIASDATGSMIVFWTDGASIPAGWTCISCAVGNTFYQRFPKGGAAYGTQGGVTTQSHTADGTVNASTAANSENRSGTLVAISSHSHTVTPTIGSTTTLPAYRQLRVIQSNSAGDPGTIPAGAILMFDGALPSGWAEYAPLSDRYPYGENAIASAGSNTHTHSVTGTTGAAAGTTVDARTGGASITAADANHTHALSSTTPALSHEPPFITVIFATSSTATATPVNAIAMWSDTPPAGWLDRSSTSDKPFYDKYVKGASTYGTTGGAELHSHANTSFTSAAASPTRTARSGATGASGAHTHVIDVSNFSTASNTPPYTTAIFGKFYGYVPIYDQAAYRWYANTNAQTPTDFWPAGGDAVDENQEIDSTLTPVKNGDVIRLRIALDVSNSTTTGESFKLQYGTTTAECTAVPSWTDVGQTGSSTAWIGYNNTSVADGVTLSSTTLTGTDRLESYEETNPTVTLPNEIGVGDRGEWDFVLKQNGAEEGTNYCFRMVESDGTELFSYAQYPKLITNQAPNAPTLTKLFDNEKSASTTPWFEFFGTDPESNDMSYQIQIDDDYTFGSVNIDNNTVSNAAQFENLTTPADKDPYTNGDTIRFTPSSPLTNNITYYWRVRAQDTAGSNAWGAWSTIYSFTIDTSVTLSTWHQTTGDQFVTGTAEFASVAGDSVVGTEGIFPGYYVPTPIDFNDGEVGNAWGSFAYSSVSVLLQIQYLNSVSNAWELIPDTDLPGNSGGLSSGASLLNLDTDTYRYIRPLATFDNAAPGETLFDWTVTWGYRIDTPTLTSPFPNEKVGTTTPTFEFSTSDPQSDDLEYEIQWSTNYAFTASTTRNSSSTSGFVNITNGGDTNPFNSGDTIQFTIQPADALVNGSTYWWRVRARDPFGSNEWSLRTTPQSITIDTTVNVSTWFQTTNEQFDTDILSGAVTQAVNTVTVATTSRELLAAYAEGTLTAPLYKLWNGSSWSSGGSALDVGSIVPWVVSRAHPSENEYILATLGTDADVNVQVYTNGAWGNLQEVTASVANTNMRGFDVSYEQLSGDALIVYCDGDADPSYYVWNGASWTSGGAIGLSSGNTCGWVKLLSDPVSDEIIAVTRDTSGTSYEARVWDGSTWGNSATWGSMQASQANHEGIAAEYEESGNQAVVAVSNGTSANFSWRAWNGTTWTGAATQALGDDFESGNLVADDGSDNMALCYMDEDGDLGAVRWTGAAWTGQTELEVALTNTSDEFNDRPVDCVYEVGGARDGNIMVVYTDGSIGGTRYRFWNGATWSAEASIVSGVNSDGERVQLRRGGDNALHAVVLRSATDLYASYMWNGSVWTSNTPISSDGATNASPFKEPFMLAAKNPVATAAVAGDPGIDFYAGSGPYWQQMSWTDTESGGSSILYQVEYYDGDSWELVPDSLIPGNSAGTSSSPINLSSVLPVATYNTLRPVANMTCNLGTCPTLSDWTVTWAEGITISGTAKQFDQSTNVAAGTVAVAINGVLQIGKTGAILGGTWSIANVNVAPGDMVTVFVSGASDENEAVNVTRYDGVGNMTGLDLYEQHLTIGSDDAGTDAFSNANIGAYDFTQDEDLFFDVTGSALDMCAEAGCANSELFIRASTTYTPGGLTDLNNVEINGNFNMEGNTIYVGRSWDNNGTTTSATSSVVFTATSTTETIDETGALTPTFYNLTFGTTTGNATWTVLTPLDVNNDLTVTRGTFDHDSQPITIGGSLTNAANGIWAGIGTTTFDGTGTDTWTDSSATLQNIGKVVIDGTSKTITFGSNVKAESITIGADDVLDVTTSNRDITVYGDWVNNNTFVARAGEVFMNATTTNRIITAGSDAFYDLTFSGAGGAWSFTEAGLTVGNNFTVSTGTVTMPTGTTTLAGSWNSVGGTFAHNNSTLYLTAAAAKTIAASGTPFTNNFYNLTMNGSGSWTFLDANATTSNDFRIQSGAVTLPSATLAVGGNFANTGGTFAHNSGTVEFTSASAKTIDTNSSFSNLSFTGSGSWSFIDASVTALGSLTVSDGSLTLPSGTLTLGGSFTNTASVTHNSGTVLFNSSDVGETVNLGSSPLYNMNFSSATGGWTITSGATTTNNFSLTAVSAFTLANAQTLSVFGTFTNGATGASTTWTGSTLSLEAGNYSLNTKTSSGDAYDTIRLKTNTDIKMWNSSASSYALEGTASLYSQDHAGVDGDLYVFGAYERTTGNEHWSYATDFDGTALTASTSRAVRVRFADGAAASITGSMFQVLGTPGATTTISNQGGGTYTVNVGAATSTLNYYDFNDLGASGLSLSGSGAITSLSYGAYTPGVNGGTALTVASSTIDANAGLQIFGIEFSTTTAISATNVTQTGGAPASYWWFRESSGNLDGEAFDNDTGDPGSIRWDDSSLTITVSGTVYADDGVTPIGASVCDDVTQNIRIVVDGSASYTGSCASGDSSFSIGGVVVGGDPILTIYLDTNGSMKGTVITRTPTADITDLDIYANRVITRHEDVAPLTILNMAVYDGDNDPDIPFTAATGTLSVNRDTELHIASSTTFVADGNITISGNASSTVFDGSLHIDNNATFTGSGTSTYTIGGSFTMDAGATFTAASSTVVMNATTTGKTITTTASQEISFYMLEFNGVGGSWNINGDVRAIEGINLVNGTVTGTADIMIVNGSLSGNGTLSMGAGTTTIQSTNTLGGTTPWTFANLVLGSGALAGTTTPGSTATTTVLGKLTISTAHFLDAGGSILDLAGTGNVFVENGTFLEGTSTVRYSGTAATNVISTTYHNLDLKAQGGAPTYTARGLGIIVLNDLTVGGPTTTTITFDMSDPALDVNGDVLIASNGSFIGSGSAITTVGGDWVNNGTFTGSNGAITFDGGVSSNITPGNSPFSNVVVNGTGSVTIGGHATATAAFTLTNAGAFTLADGQSLAVGGTFTNSEGGAATTWTNSTLYLYGGGNYAINGNSVSDAYGTLRIGSGTQIRMWNSSAATYDVSSTGSLYSMDHAGVDGDLYIFGAYTKISGTDFWNYAEDFDGTALGSPRNVDVHVASGSSVLFTGGSLSVIGTSTGTTTIQNQGSGTYSLRVGGTASTTWSYYQVRNTDVAGLTFSGTPNVVNISNGNFEVGLNNGTAMTIGGTVINQNQAKTFTNNYFGTNGAAPAFNVTATGTTVSSWRFTNHSGAIAGEANDVDPNGDPGYLVWDDSAALITVSGAVYSDEGTTVSGVCDGTTNNVHLRVAGLTSYTTSCAVGTGAYSIPGVAYSAGDSLIVYIDGEAEKAATVTEDPVSNINDMHLYENRVIVRHENTDPLSIVDMAIWDSSDDADIPFAAIDGSPDTLTLPANRKLIVWTGKTFRPTGNVTVTGGGAGAAHDGTLELYGNAVFDATGAETHTVGGSLVTGVGSSIDDETSQFIFTTNGAARVIDTNEYPLYNVNFNGSGSWNIANTAFDLGGFLVISQGSVTLPNGTTTVADAFQVLGGSFNANGGTVKLTSNGPDALTPGGSNFHNLVIDATGSYTLSGGYATATGNVRIENGTFTSATGTFAIAGNFVNDGTFNHGSGLLRFTSGTGATVTASSSDLYSVTFAGAGSHTFTDQNLALRGTLRIEAGAVALPTGTMSVGGSFLNTGGTFTHATGTILFNSADTGESVTTGGSSFTNVSFASAGGGWTMTDDATTTGNFSITSATNFTLSSSTRLTVEGVFTNLVGGAATTWSGSTLAINSGTGYTINTKAAGGDVYNNLLIGSSTALRAWDTTGTITMMDADSSFYSQDHAGVSGSLYVFGDYVRSAGADYWSYATDFDGTALGGSSRQAFVYHSEGASTTVSTGGALNIVGANGFDTTINNQGSGTFGMNMLGGTLNAQYYSISNMGINGLQLLGETVITSLSEGNFTLAVNGGSLITLASTTLNFNAGLVITGASFATTTPITGYNVNLIGSTPSAWTFTGHTGNFDGENFDNDGVDACGSLRWDDSSCLLTEQSAYRFRNDDGGEGVPNSEWYNLSWTKRKRVTVTNADPLTYTNAAIKLTVAYDADMQADFEDLRFTTSDGVTATAHFIETYTASTEAVVWVKVPTLATSTNAQIYMYYGNGAVSDGSATTTFTFMDDFEDGNISEYSGDTGIFAVDGSFAYEGAFGLDATGNEGAKATDGIYRTDVTIGQGQTLRYLQYIDTALGSGDETCTLFGVQTPGSNNQNYAVCLELFGTDRVSISKDVDNNDTSGTVLATTTISYVTGWHEVEIDWATDDSISVTVSQDGAVVATTSATDSSYTQGGIGFTFWFQRGGWDIYSSRPLLTTEPSTAFGAEQVSGGASWAGALNTPVTGISAGETSRLRFLVENSGLPVTAQNYELEFAPKGAAPSCEAVDYNNYVEVPNAALCGTSDICMKTSGNVANLESTTDLLGGTGTFAPGQVVEDPSNNTGNLDVGGSEYTELEYVIETTQNVTDSKYCLRVTNEGVDLDSYARIAELQLIFIPNITSLTLNGGLDITLTGGATTTVTATGTVSDLNGYTDLAYATTTIFRSGVGESCTFDNNNCYISGPSRCTFVNCSGNSCDVECTADIYYHADPTDIGTYAGETWRALLSVSDTAGSVATATAPSIDLLTLRAIAVDSSINYGTLSVNADTGSYNATTTVENIGNDSIDVAIEGTDLTDGGSSAIPVSEQIFATSTFTYSSCVFCSSLSTTSASIELNLNKPASTTPAITDEIFWGIAVPFGVAGTPHAGVNTFYAVGD